MRWGCIYLNRLDVSDPKNEIRGLVLLGFGRYAHIHWHFKFWKGLPWIDTGRNSYGLLGERIVVHGDKKCLKQKAKPYSS